MRHHTLYRKFVFLAGKQVLLRSLSCHDQGGLIRMFLEAPEPEVRYLKRHVEDPHQLHTWLTSLTSQPVLPLVAVDLAAHRFVGLTLFTRDQRGGDPGGQVHLFVAEPFRVLGLPGLLLEELLDLTKSADLRWLSAEVAAADRLVVKAFRDQGFEIRATLEDLFLNECGCSRPVLLMTRPAEKPTNAKEK